jgi:hypothetical protein
MMTQCNSSPWAPQQSEAAAVGIYT